MKKTTEVAGVIETVIYESSVIHSTVYNTKSGDLVVAFKKNGTDSIPYTKEYSYKGVSVSDYETFRDADSTGKVFNVTVKGKYNTTSEIALI